MITRGPKKDVQYYTDMLMTEYIHFLEDAIANTEKITKIKIKYENRIRFDSNVLDRQK